MSDHAIARLEIVPSHPISRGRGGAVVMARTPSATPHYVRLVAANGTTLAHSETYSTRSNARRAARDWLRIMRDITHGPRPWARIQEVTQ